MLFLRSFFIALPQLSFNILSSNKLSLLRRWTRQHRNAFHSPMRLFSSSCARLVLAGLLSFALVSCRILTLRMYGQHEHLGRSRSSRCGSVHLNTFNFYCTQSILKVRSFRVSTITKHMYGWHFVTMSSKRHYLSKFRYQVAP